MSIAILSALGLLVALVLIVLGLQLREARRLRTLRHALDNRDHRTRIEAERRTSDRQEIGAAIHQLEVRLEGRLGEVQRRLSAEGGEARERMLQRLHGGLQTLRGEIVSTLDRGAKQVDGRMAQLIEANDQRLMRISGKVEERLAEGFEKTNATFTEVMNQLTKMDQAQQRLQELSSNVVGLQQVLNDKKSLGAFGEVQLEALIENMLPPDSYDFQHTLRNGKRPDCALLLPEPTGTICIDAKFPLQDFQVFSNPDFPESEREAARKRFLTAVKGHVDDIADKYVAAEDTWSGAFMFVPSEAVFSEIHARHPELVAHAQAQRVFLTSPSTLMAVCMTAASVLKDKATRDQVHVIQESLGLLAKHFDKFHGQLSGLSKNIRNAGEKADRAEREADRIRTQFRKIERVELEPGELRPPRLEECASNDDT